MSRPKTEYEVLVEEFEKSDAELKDYLSMIENGDFIKEIFDNSLGNSNMAKEHWLSLWDKVRSLTEERNVKLSQAKDALRSAIISSQNGPRGPDAKAETLKSGKFLVTSTTNRSLNAEKVIEICSKLGILDELKEASYMDSNGTVVPLLKQEWFIEYGKAKEWLIAKGHENIIQLSYQEIEKTPRVTGPKKLAMLGEKLE